MKKQHFAILLAALVLGSCGSRPTARYNRNLDEPMYYYYNPEDTIGNEPYWLLLKIDSARVEFLSDSEMAMRPTARIKEIVGDSVVLVDKDRGDTSSYDAAESKWFELLRLCSQRQYEDALSLYIKEETEIGIALATSTNKFELDYFVIGKLLFQQLDGEEAVRLLTKFLEYDKLLTESVVAFSTVEGGSGYIPPQYAFQLEILCRTYLIMEDREKAEAPKGESAEDDISFSIDIERGLKTFHIRVGGMVKTSN